LTCLFGFGIRPDSETLKEWPRYWFPTGKPTVKFLSFGVAIVFTLMAIVLIVAITGCTTTQKTVGGAVAGGVTGAVVAGPIGAAVGAGGGAVAGSVIGGRS
jgi:osmotically inducible lipoprotein OsmB